LRQYFDPFRPSQAYYHYIRNDSNKTLYLMEEHTSVEIPPGIEKEAGRPRWVRLFSYDELRETPISQVNKCSHANPPDEIGP
jgi:hypothetical protein